MNKLMWIDLEMTGLDVQKEVIIEVAVVVTNLKMEHIENYHSIVKQPQSYLDQMDEWNTNQHGASGLTDLVPSGQAPHLVEKDLVELCQKHFADEKVIIAGNSIAQDRLFIDKYFKDFSNLLHYRMLDVSSFKLVFNNIYRYTYNKKSTNHRALEDIEESINELKAYMSHIKI
ncbi:MAG: oligoribonuclease [Bdellovibrionales bacterium]|nr:oligoribonuclease [Bdellovibrionales bacterium]